MPETNLELVRQGYEAWNRGDWDGVFALFEPRSKFDHRSSGHRPQRSGARRCRTAFEAALQTIEDQPAMQVGELPEIGDRVRASVPTDGRGSGSGSR
jgi:hypothetical protein